LSPETDTGDRNATRSPQSHMTGPHHKEII
jgi:hypothetical protein